MNNSIFNTGPPKVRLTGDDPDPDPVFHDHLIEEGFAVDYIPFNDGGKPYRDILKNLSNDLALGENYAIVAFGAAAATCLEFYAKPAPHLAALVAYYPTAVLDPRTKYPPHLQLLTHLAGEQGLPSAAAMGWASYSYRGTQPGFAESDLDTYDKVAASISWTRTLRVLRKAFEIDKTSALERVHETHLTQKYAHKDALATVKSFVEEGPSANHVPTMTGGLGQKDLFLFYRDYFLPDPPPSLSLKLLSRTIDIDRVVDEILLSFKHTVAVPHVLPGVPPTGKNVRIPAVSVVTIRGGRLVQERMYWDQASVLVQVGLLDPELVPEVMKSKGMQRLPVYGAEVAAKVLDDEAEASNELIPEWADRPKGDPGVQRGSSRPASVADDDGT